MINNFLNYISPIVGSVAGGLFDRFNAYSTNKAAMAAEDRAYSKNLNMWNRVNAYNHPAEQMARLRQAGLNPNLLYQQPVNPAAQNINANMHQRATFGQNFDKLQGYLSLQNMLSQSRNIDAQTRNLDAQTAVAKRDLSINPSDPPVLKIIDRAPEIISTFPGKIWEAYQKNISIPLWNKIKEKYPIFKYNKR